MGCGTRSAHHRHPRRSWRCRRRVTGCFCLPPKLGLPVRPRLDRRLDLRDMADGLPLVYGCPAQPSGRTSSPPPPDSTGAVQTPPIVTALRASLRRALRQLEDEFGPVGAGWRWQNVQRATRYYPLFTRDTSKTGQRRFAPTLRPDGGHPTALAWGPSPVFPAVQSTASWSARGDAPDWSRVLIRHRNPYASAFRSRRATDPVEPYGVERTTSIAPSVRLVPPDE